MGVGAVNISPTRHHHPWAIYNTDGYNFPFHPFDFYLFLRSSVLLSDNLWRGGDLIVTHLLRHYRPPLSVCRDPVVDRDAHNAAPPRRSRTAAGAIAALSRPFPALCSSHFSPVSDPSASFTFQSSSPFPLILTRGLSNERAGKRELSPLGSKAITVWKIQSLASFLSQPLLLSYYFVGTHFCLLCTSGASALLFFISPYPFILTSLRLPLLSLIPPTSNPVNSPLQSPVFALSLSKSDRQQGMPL